MFTSDAENSTMGTSMTVDIEEDFDEARGGPGGHVETESDDEDLEATRRYWEVKRKKEGVHKVCFSVSIANRNA